ncbi:hypothetical protein Tco_0895618 [Tanacetum coccineum]|uniref:Uncharacterized protein n=1 Tax=Tanacetum coccineum TaxID=301880 RepID=A0ABQ5CIJ3_9ASTR
MSSDSTLSASPEIAPLSPDYVPGPEEPEQTPLSPEYVPEPVYPEYLAPSDNDISIEYQPLPADASSISLSLGYVADSNLEEDPEEDSEDDLDEDPTDYPADRGDEEDDESSGDDADDEDEEEASEEEDDDEEEVEHLAPADSSTVPNDDPVPSAEETEPFETDESAPTSPSPRLRRARISIPSPPLPLPSPPLPLPAPSPPLLLLATDRREDVLEADPGLDVTYATDYGFFDTKDATLGRLMTREVGYGITDVWDDMVGDMEETAPTTLEVVNQRIADLATTLAHDTHEIYVRDRRYFNAMMVAFEKEAMYAHGAWAGSEDRSAAIETHVRALETQVTTLMAQTLSLQTQLTTTLGRIQTLEAREPTRIDDPEYTDSSA